MATMTVLDSGGNPVTVEKPLPPGTAAAAASRPVALSTEDAAVQSRIAVACEAVQAVAEDTTTVSLVKDSRSGEYETVAASATDQVLGASGAIGDALSHLVIVPATTSPGAVSIKDGSGSAITVFAGGTVTSVIPFTVALDMVSLSGAWKVTTGTNVSVIAVGSFS